MKLKTKVSKSGGYYTAGPIRGLTRKDLDELIKEDETFLKKVGYSFTDTKKLKVAELRSLMVYGDPSKALSPKSKTSKKSSKKTSKKVSKKTSKKVSKKTSPKKKSTKAKKSSKKVSKKTSEKKTSEKKSVKKPKKTSKKVHTPRSPTTKMTIKELRQAYKDKFDQSPPKELTKKIDLVKAVKAKKPIKTKKSVTTKKSSVKKGRYADLASPVTGKKSREEKEKKETRKKSKSEEGELSLSDMKKDQLVDMYTDKFGESPPPKGKKSNIIKALKTDKPMKHPKPKGKKSKKDETESDTEYESVTGESVSESGSEFQICGDGEYMDSDGGCKKGNLARQPYLKIEGRANIYGVESMLEKIKAKLGGSIVFPDKLDETPVKKTPKKDVEVASDGGKLNLTKRTEILAAIKDRLQKCIDEESKAILG